MSTLTKQLFQEEGSRSHAYKDSRGFLTIGVGRLIDSRIKSKGLTEEEQLFLLSNDLKEIDAALDRILPWSVRLNEARRAVLVGMAFQLGVSGLLKFKTTLRHIEAANFDAAAKSMLASRWAKQTPARAQRMAEQMRTDEWQAGPGFTLP